LIKNGTGDVVGAIGVTGDSADNDEIVAAEAVAAVGLAVDCH
jgi:uncharacterized protein GlcG (DUF336 family)